MAIREVDLGKVRGDINDSQATFTQSETRTNIVSGEKGSVIFGKIKKWFADLGTAAFCTVANNATTTAANTVLDGRMGKTLQTGIDTLNNYRGGMSFSTQRLPDVTEEYSSNNILYHNGKILYPENYANATFLIALNSSVTLGKATLYLVMLGTEVTAAGVSIVRLDLSTTSDEVYPKLERTTSGRLYVVWSKTANALIRANTFKLHQPD